MHADGEGADQRPRRRGRRPPRAGACRSVRSHMARMSGSQAAAAMIIGNTTDHDHEAAELVGEPAKVEPARPSPSVRMKTNMNTPARARLSTVNQP